MLQYTFPNAGTPGAQPFSAFGHISPHNLTFVQTAETLQQQGEACQTSSTIDYSESFHQFNPTDKALLQNTTAMKTQVPIYTPQIMQTFQSPVQTIPNHISSLQGQQLPATQTIAPATTPVCCDLDVPQMQWTENPDGMTAVTTPTVTQYLALLKETSKLREEVIFWKRIAKQQSKYSLQKDEETKKLQSQLSEIEVSHLLMKKLYSAEVESSSRSKLLHLRTIKSLVDEKVDELKEMEKNV